LAPLVNAATGRSRQARSSRACLRLAGRHETGQIAARYLAIWMLIKGESVMKSLIAAVIAAAALLVVGPAAVNPATAAPPAKSTAGTSDATDFSAHRYHRRYYRHYGYRPHYRHYHRPYYRPVYQPYYYGRPHYYRPYPYYAPAPFSFGIGFGPVWW
jgi:hypothetical protein